MCVSCLACCRATHGLPCLGTGVPWASLLGPLVCHRVHGGSVAKRQPFVVCIGVVTSCVPCARVRTSRSCATENTCSTGSAVQAPSRHHSQSFVPFHQIFCGLWVLVPTRHLVEDHIDVFLACCQQCKAVASVLGHHCDLGDVIHAVLRVSCVVSIFNCRQSAKL